MRTNVPTIITCAVTGNHTTRQHHPELPVTPEEIARASIEAAQAGAAIVHLHVRDPATGDPSTELSLYRDAVELIRSSGTDVIINLTTGPGGRFVPDDDVPSRAGPGTTLTTAERRAEHIAALRPELCSLDLNTMWSGAAAVINAPRILGIMAGMIKEAGTKPELEVFDSGDIHLAHDLVAKGVIDEAPLFQIVLGVKYGANATTRTMAYLSSLLPAGSPWSAFGIGRMQFPMVAQSFLLGGHVRVGLEDNVYLAKNVLAPSNAALVEKAKRILLDLGGSVATAEQARSILRIG